MLNLFIDTNIFLNFFHYSDDDLEELRKLSKLLENKEIMLYLTEQVKHEFYRNKEVKINDALQTLAKAKIGGAFPQFCKEYDEYHQLKSLVADYDKRKKELINRMKEDISGEKLKADSIIGEIFESGNLIDSNQYYGQAVERQNLGDPPGKKGSYGGHDKLDIAS